MAQNRAKSRGFSDVLYLDSDSKKNLEEVSSCNIFIAKGKKISTPAISGTILPGITRKSVIEIASDLGYQVKLLLHHCDNHIHDFKTSWTYKLFTLLFRWKSVLFLSKNWPKPMKFSVQELLLVLLL